MTAGRKKLQVAPALAVCLILAIGLASYGIAQVQPPQEEEAPAPEKDKRTFLWTLEGSRPTLIEDITDSEQQIVDEHFERLEKLHKQGTVVLVGRCVEKPLGIILLETTSLQDAQDIARNDPAVKAGIMRANVYPFRVYMGKLPESD